MIEAINLSLSINYGCQIVIFSSRHEMMVLSVKRKVLSRMVVRKVLRNTPNDRPLCGKKDVLCYKKNPRCYLV